MTSRIITLADGTRFAPYIGPGALRNKIKSLAKALNRDYLGRSPVFIGVLNGSFMFCADLARHLDLDCEFDFIKLSSYRGRSRNPGPLMVRQDLRIPIRGRDIVIVEDIVDSGNSVKFLRRHLGMRHPRTLKVISLLYKKAGSGGGAKPDYHGFTIPGHFVVGFGLDYDHKLRNMRGIYRMTAPAGSDQDGK
jgi:hypoxanthine phosphoribosyltransferase